MEPILTCFIHWNNHGTHDAGKGGGEYRNVQSMSDGNNQYIHTGRRRTRRSAGLGKNSILSSRIADDEKLGVAATG